MEHMGLGMSWSQLTFTPWFFRGVGRKTTNQNISLMGPIKRITSRGLRWWIWFAPSMRSGSPSGGHEGPRGWKRHEKLRVSLTSWIYAMTVYPRVKIEKKYGNHMKTHGFPIRKMIHLNGDWWVFHMFKLTWAMGISVPRVGGESCQPNSNFSSQDE